MSPELWLYATWAGYGLAAFAAFIFVAHMPILPVIRLLTLPIPHKPRIIRCMLGAWVRNTLTIPADLLAPVVVPIALAFTRWDAERLPWLFAWWDNDASINGDVRQLGLWDLQPIPLDRDSADAVAVCYWAPGHHPRSFWARYVWLGIRNRASRLSQLLSVGAAPFVARSGQVVQSVYQENAANTVISATIPADSTIPQVTEGTQVLAATITPTSAGNTLEVEAVVHGSELTNVGDSILVALFRDGGANAVAASFVGGMNGGGNHLTSGTAVIRYRVAAGSTAATTFTVRVGNNTGSMTLNATHQNINLGGLIASTLTVREISV